MSEHSKNDLQENIKITQSFPILPVSIKEDILLYEVTLPRLSALSNVTAASLVETDAKCFTSAIKPKEKKQLRF